MKRFVVALVLFMIAMPLVYLYALSTETKPAVTDSKPVGPPALAVWVKKPMEGGMIEDARITTLGTRCFLVGKQSDIGLEKDDLRKGVVYWYPLEDVQGMIEFPTLKDAKEYYDKTQDLEN